MEKSVIVDVLMWAYCFINICAFAMPRIEWSKASFACGNLFCTAGALIAGQMGVAALCASVSLRQLISVFTFQMSSITRALVCALFVTLTSLVIVLTEQAGYQTLLVANAIWSTIVFFYAKGRWFHVVLMVSCALWMTNGYLAGHFQIVLASLPGVLISAAKTFDLKFDLLKVKTS